LLFCARVEKETKFCIWIEPSWMKSTYTWHVSEVIIVSLLAFKCRLFILKWLNSISQP
jgi:hypothetical protein